MPLDNAFQRFWSAKSPQEAAKLADDIVEKSDVTFDEALRRLRLGRAYSAQPGGVLQLNNHTEDGVEHFYAVNIPAGYDPARRYQTIQWVHFQMGGIGPMFGQVGFFHKFAGREYEDKRPLQRYVNESKRLLGVMETHLAGRQWFLDDEYTIADISMLGWVRNLVGFYGARELVAFDDFKNVAGWLERGLARPAVQRGLNIPPRP